MLKKLKLWQIILGIGLLTIVLGAVLIPIFSKDESNNIDKVDKRIVKLLENDYLVSKALYDEISVDEANASISGVIYYYVKDEKLSSISDLQNMISSTYDNSFIYTVYQDVDKYNKYVEVDNELYVNINNVCKVKDFDKNVTIIKNGTNEITGKSNGKEFTAIKDDSGNFKLTSSVYKCN